MSGSDCSIGSSTGGEHKDTLIMSKLSEPTSFSTSRIEYAAPIVVIIKGMITRWDGGHTKEKD